MHVVQQAEHSQQACSPPRPVLALFQMHPNHGIPVRQCEGCGVQPVCQQPDTGHLIHDHRVRWGILGRLHGVVVQQVKAAVREGRHEGQQSALQLVLLRERYGAVGGNAWNVHGSARQGTRDQASHNQEHLHASAMRCSVWSDEVYDERCSVPRTAQMSIAARRVQRCQGGPTAELPSHVTKYIYNISVPS